ncbi:MAG TPA: PqiC family protein [Steroidobacteraceae bacterium]|jgi:hypothetical protein|nr:PqiC family protein [Steroidobacteraceae bacterium]
MRVLKIGICAVALLAGCVTGRADHFYELQTQPAGSRQSRSQFDRQVTLRVTVASMLDRNEMVLTTRNGVTVLDHERWAAPLADLITTTLGQDVEARRVDAVVLPKSADKSGIPLIRMAIDIDRLDARLGEPLRMEVHWRVTDASTGRQSLGRDTLVSQRQPQSYDEIAAALSECVAQLADRLVSEIPT